MKAALLPDRGVVKVAGDGAQSFLNGLFTADIGQVTLECAALCRAADAARQDHHRCHHRGGATRDGGGFFLDVPRVLAKTCVDRLNFYKLRAKVMVEDLSRGFGVMAAVGRRAGQRIRLVLPRPAPARPGPAGDAAAASRAAQAAADLGAALVPAAEFEAHRIALGVPRGGLDFCYGEAFPHEADMDQLHGVDFAKGCFVGQEVVSRMEHRGIARTRIVPVAYDGFAPDAGAPSRRPTSRSAPSAPPRKGERSRCCASTAPPMRSPPATSSSPGRLRCASSSRTGRDSRFPARRRKWKPIDGARAAP